MWNGYPQSYNWGAGDSYAGPYRGGHRMSPNGFRAPTPYGSMSGNYQSRMLGYHPNDLQHPEVNELALRANHLASPMYMAQNNNNAHQFPPGPNLMDRNYTSFENDSRLRQQARTSASPSLEQQAARRWLEPREVSKLDLQYEVNSIEGTVRWATPMINEEYEYEVRLLGHRDDCKTFPYWKTFLKLKVVPGSWYTIKVKAISKLTGRRVIAEGECKFKSILSRNELIELYQRAVDYIGTHDLMMHRFDHFYRNKPLEYWNECRHKGLIMEKYIKDQNGQPGTPVNDEIKGLFFSARLLAGQFPRSSIYGDHRFIIKAHHLFNDHCRLYFSDFYCNYAQHYITIILTLRGSDTDVFCNKHLVEMNKEDNIFLMVKKFQMMREPEYWINNHIWVEILYTEDVNLRLGIFQQVQVSGRGRSTPGGLQNNKYCNICNLYPDDPPRAEAERLREIERRDASRRRERRSSRSPGPSSSRRSHRDVGDRRIRRNGSRSKSRSPQRRRSSRSRSKSRSRSRSRDRDRKKPAARAGDSRRRSGEAGGSSKSKSEPGSTRKADDNDFVDVEPEPDSDEIQIINEFIHRSLQPADTTTSTYGLSGEIAKTDFGNAEGTDETSNHFLAYKVFLDSMQVLCSIVDQVVGQSTAVVKGPSRNINSSPGKPKPNSLVDMMLARPKSDARVEGLILDKTDVNIDFNASRQFDEVDILDFSDSMSASDNREISLKQQLPSDNDKSIDLDDEKLIAETLELTDDPHHHSSSVNGVVVVSVKSAGGMSYRLPSPSDQPTCTQTHPNLTTITCPSNTEQLSHIKQRLLKIVGDCPRASKPLHDAPTAMGPAGESEGDEGELALRKMSSTIELLKERMKRALADSSVVDDCTGTNDPSLGGGVEPVSNPELVAT